jgi:hypothetical protein
MLYSPTIRAWRPSRWVSLTPLLKLHYSLVFTVPECDIRNVG